MSTTPSTWRREAEAAAAASRSLAEIAAELPESSTVGQALGDRANDLRLLAALRGVTA